jgi:glutamate dehydrogenase
VATVGAGSSDRWTAEPGEQLSRFGSSAESGHLRDRYDKAFSDSFVETHPAAGLSEYVDAIEEQAARSSPVLRVFVPPRGTSEAPGEGMRLGLVWADPAPAALADLFPVLENLGVRVAAHAGHRIQPADRPAVLLEEFTLVAAESSALLDPAVTEALTAAFDAVWTGAADDDPLNQLVIRVGLSWREVTLLRAAYAYLRQGRTAYSPGYVQRTLLAHPHLVRLLVALFRARFDPSGGGPEQEQKVRQEIEAGLNAVENISEDRLLRSFLSVLLGTTRTNFYQFDAQQQPKGYLALKFEPEAFDFLPLPRPQVETLVFSPRMEGLHLRSSRVARGGIRWSDRPEDYRTEVLALMKAQRVKNAVIVPHGAKGAFIVKRPPAGDDRSAMAKEVLDCYLTFVRGLLDVTDNRVDGDVEPPESVVCHDGPDPYLVVAADKGTATFSDAANALAVQHSFWLGDAFASGGSAGYDHKALGVTARGAWESLRRHLGEMGLDPSRDPVSVVGIGDMSGDVFGNGMLLSDRIRLVAAFDHRHVFLDPDPDPTTSYAERARLFALPRSSWADYDVGLISAGGGVFPRTAKTIPLSAEVRRLLGVTAEQLTADDLIRTVLQADVDVLYNGGIGTYVKASTESHADAGDRASDAVRVDARNLRARVVVEGGNLGLTQLARVEFALAGGRINSDFIDNSAGVETSDREVNIKILLQAAVKAGRLTMDRRDVLLRETADQVVEQVLATNAAQAQSISVSHALGSLLLDPLVEVIRLGEQMGALDRAQEYLPDDEELARRRDSGVGLTRPEIAVLLATSKNIMTQWLLDSDVPDDDYVGMTALASYMPPALDEFSDLLSAHPLRREIAVTVLVNEIYNRLGSGVLLRVLQLTGQTEPELVLGYVASRDVFALPLLWAQIDSIDLASGAQLQIELLLQIRAVVERSIRWFLRHRDAVRPADEVAVLRTGVELLTRDLGSVLPPDGKVAFSERVSQLIDQGTPVDLAQELCALRPLSNALDLVEAASARQADLPWLARLYFRLGELLDMDWLRTQSDLRPDDSHWLMLAKTSLSDELSTLQCHIAVAIHGSVGGEQADADEAVLEWSGRNQSRIEQYRANIDQLRQATEVDLAMLSVAVEGLRRLLYATTTSDVTHH